MKGYIIHPSWGVYRVEESKSIHVLPEDEKDEHILNEVCMCGTRTEGENGWLLVTHRKFR
jgi:hypothetical protein